MPADEPEVLVASVRAVVEPTQIPCGTGSCGRSVLSFALEGVCLPQVTGWR